MAGRAADGEGPGRETAASAGRLAAADPAETGGTGPGRREVPAEAPALRAGAARRLAHGQRALGHERTGRVSVQVSAHENWPAQVTSLHQV